jgi:pimeloyl-ACP methyl ester carboxylesterase
MELQTLAVNGRRLEALRLGPGPERAPTLVFLHDGLGCVATWRDFPAALAAETGCGALLYSRLGYGGSDPVELPRPLSYMHHEGRVSLGQVLDAAGVREAFLVGHGDGGSIALLHAATPAAEPRVRGLLLEAPHVFCEDCSVLSIQKERER